MLENIFDSHAHYDAQQFDQDREAVLNALPSQGVRAVMTCADNIASCYRVAEISKNYDYIYCSTGVHPHDASTATPELEDLLREFAKNPKMRAIGEIGLDYYYDHSPRDCQRKVLERQLAVAKELDLPVIIHDRDAHEDTLAILKEHRPKGIIHSYSGSVESAEILLDMGFYLGFTGVVTFKNAKKPGEVVAHMPLERLLLETDCPYLAPEPLRGKRSESPMIVYTAAKIAEIKQLPVQQVLNVTYANACAVYQIASNRGQGDEG